MLLATDKPVLAAPAMNVRMWEHAATQRKGSLPAALRADGTGVFGPNEGDRLAGDSARAPSAEPAAILDAVAGEVTPLRKKTG